MIETIESSKEGAGPLNTREGRGYIGMPLDHESGCGVKESGGGIALLAERKIREWLEHNAPPVGRKE